MSEPLKIAVIGAGPMGLAVAYQLVRDGHRPVIYEAAPRPGGMAVCFDFGGDMIERFYHFHATSDDDFFALLDELGLGQDMRWVNTKMGYYYRGEVQDWGNPTALLRFRGLGLAAKFRYALHAFLCTKRRDWSGLDRQRAKPWLRKWVGAEAYETLWRRLIDYKFYHEGDDLSAAWIWSRVRRIGLSRESLMKEKLGYLQGGSQAYIDAVVAAIEAGGGSFRLGAPVEEVTLDGPRVTGIRSGGGQEDYDLVISTAPLPYVPQMIPDLPATLRDQYAAIRNVAVVCVIAKLARPLTDKFWLNVNDPEMDIPGLVEYTNLRPMDHTIVYVPFYMPGDHPSYLDSDAAFCDKVRRYLRTINPALTEEDILDVIASRYRYSQPVCGPGFLDTLPPANLPIQGLWVADTSYYYPEDRGISESTGYGRQMARDAVAAALAAR
ncbi:NAD(P)/FAD-dependent oxidoreductase [Litorisediminicola beolgyonensis]|uniref:NAD(P)/FAD-dependent oxidoreductase n=1 Tax=Litorisediminicola beolgyonensis TaxID=1173614 RepID=A0ABW3ZER9_9RHOB